MKNRAFNLPHLFFLTLLTITFSPTNLLAETIYVGDTLIISLRSGPNKSSKSLETIKTGTALTVLEKKGEYIKVETKKGVVGWVPKFYTDSTPPKALVIKNLETQLKRLQKEAGKLASSNEEMITRLEELTTKESSGSQKASDLSLELEQLKEKYQTLLVGSEQILTTTSERDRLQKEVHSLQEQFEKIADENLVLSDYRMIFWFLAGAGTFLLGWLIGKLSKRGQKRSISL